MGKRVCVGPSNTFWKSGKVRKNILSQNEMQIIHFKEGEIH